MKFSAAQILLQITFISSVFAQRTLTSCDPIPTDTTESTPYTTTTQHVIANGKDQLDVIKIFKATVYVSQCSSVTISQSGAQSRTVTIF